jgi:hypothetical protein
MRNPGRGTDPDAPRVPVAPDNPTETVATFVHDGTVYEIDHLGIGVPEQWGSFVVYRGAAPLVEFTILESEMPSTGTLIDRATEALRELRAESRAGGGVRGLWQWAEPGPLPEPVPVDPAVAAARLMAAGGLRPTGLEYWIGRAPRVDMPDAPAPGQWAAAAREPDFIERDLGDEGTAEVTR